MQIKLVRFASFPMILAGCLLSQAGKAAEAEEFDAAAKYQSTCYACHGTGAAHAPEVGDVIEWEIRLEKGMETLLSNTIAGLNGIMPPRGLCTDCSDDNLKSIIEYMLENSK